MKIIETTGNADDLYSIQKDGWVKSVSTVKLCTNKEADEPCDLDITLTSFALNDKNEHKTIDKVLGHKIKFTLETIDDAVDAQTFNNPDATISVVDYNGEKWVRVQALDEDFLIAPRNLDDSKAFTYDEVMERLKDLGLDTFNKRQGELIERYIDQINDKLSEIGGDPMDKYAYVSNELCNVDGSVGESTAYYTWYFNGNIRYLTYTLRYGSSFRCRPCSSYSETNKESNPDATISVVDYNGEKWVRVQAMGEDFLIAPRDLDDSKAFTYDEAMDRLKDLGLDTFNKRQGEVIKKYMGQINTKLREIGGEPMDKYAYVSNELCNTDSSVGESTADYTWYFHGYAWLLLYASRSYSSFRCRPCVSYSETNKTNNPDATISIVEHNGEKWVRVQALGEDFMIAPRDLDNSKAFTYDEAMERLKELGLDTFNKRQGELIERYIDQINTKLSEIGGEPMDKYAYVSNEPCNADGSVGESDANFTWYFYGYYRSLYNGARYGYTLRCRPCISYSETNKKSNPDATISVVDYNNEKWVRVQALGEDFMIAPRDLDNSAKFTYDEAMERLKDLGLDTFNRKQGELIKKYIDQIDIKLCEIGGDPMDKYAYVSNELYNADGSVGESNADYPWCFIGYHRSLGTNGPYYLYFRCRPCISYSETNKTSNPDATISVVDYNGEKWVRVQALGEDFIIAPRDLDNSKEFTYDEAMERLKDLGLNTFNKRQGVLIERHIDQINDKLDEIGGDPMDVYWYVSNELCNADGSVGEFNAYNTWYFYGYHRILNHLSRSYSYFRCRPCISYN